MIGLDTNVLLRVLIDESILPADSRGQARAARALVLGSRETFFVNSLVLAETAWVLENRMQQPKEIVIQVIERLLAAANVALEARDVVVVSLAGFRIGRPGFADHLIGHTNRHAGCVTTMTFDKGARRSDLFTTLNVL